MKTDRTQRWIEFGRLAADDVVGLPADTSEDSWSVVRDCCVAPVVQLIRVTSPRVFAISGPVGAGKSTVLRCVAALQSLLRHCRALVHTEPSASLDLQTGWASVVSHHSVTSQTAPAPHGWLSCAG